MEELEIEEIDKREESNGRFHREKAQRISRKDFK